jgi:hypothetical protein
MPNIPAVRGHLFSSGSETDHLTLPLKQRLPGLLSTCTLLSFKTRYKGALVSAQRTLGISIQLSVSMVLIGNVPPNLITRGNVIGSGSSRIRYKLLRVPSADQIISQILAGFHINNVLASSFCFSEVCCPVNDASRL